MMSETAQPRVTPTWHTNQTYPSFHTRGLRFRHVLQLPLGPHVGADGERTVTEAVSPEKDVDGYAYNQFSLAFYVAPSARALRITPRELVCADSELACEPAYLLPFGFNHLEAPAPTLR